MAGSSSKYRVFFEAYIDDGSLQKQADKLSKKKINLNTTDANKNVKTLTNSIGDAIKKTIEWSIATGLVYKSLQELKKGIEFISDLDESMTNIQIVTGKTDYEIKQLTSDFNSLAKELSATTLEVSEGSLEWFRQGKTVAEAQELVTQSIMASKLANMDSAEATEYLTSIINGFKLEAEDVAGVLDKLVAVDNESATSVAELAEALKRSSNSAQQAGVDLDTLVSYIATVSSVTRKSAGSVGEAFKTLFARMQNLKLGKLDEMGEDVSDVEMVLQKFTNTTLFTADGQFRELDDVISDLAGEWENLGSVEQSAIAKAVAGVRQRENFLVLMNNFNDVLEYQEIQLNSNGLALDRYEVYQDSVQASLDRLTASWEGLWIETVQGDAIQWFYDLGASALDTITNMGGLIPVLEKVIALIIILNSQKIASLFSSIGSSLLSIIKYLPTLASVYATINTQYPILQRNTELLNVTLGTTTTTVLSVVSALYALYEAYKAVKKVTDSVEDDYANLDAQVRTFYSNVNKGTEGTDSTLQAFSQTLEEVKRRYEELNFIQKIFYNETDAVETQLVALHDTLKKDGKISYDQYREAMEKAIEMAGYQVDEAGRVYREISTGYGQAVREYVDGIELATNWQGHYIDVLESVSDVSSDAEEDIYDMAEAFSVLTDEVSSGVGLIQKQLDGEFNFSDLEELMGMYDNWADLLTVEGDLVSLNTDKLQQYNIEKARTMIETMKANTESEKEKEILDAYLQQLERAIPLSKDYVDNLQILLQNVSDLSPKYSQLTDTLINVSEQFKNGELSAQGYFEQIETLASDVNLRQMFQENSDAGEMFFAGLTQDATASLQQITSMFGAGEISFSEFTDQITELSDVFVMLGGMAEDMGVYFGMNTLEAEEWGSSVADATNNITDAKERLFELQELNAQLEQTFYEQTQNNLEFGTTAFNEHMQNIANMAVQAGVQITDAKGNILTDVNDIYNYLTGTEGNFALFSDQVANETGNTMTTLKQNIGALLVDLGNAIQNFEFDINITPQLVGTQMFQGGISGVLGSLFGGEIPTITLPEIRLGISGGGDIGKAISSYGQTLMNSQSMNLNSNVYSPLPNQVTESTSDSSKAYENIANAISTAKDETDALADATKDLADQVEDYRKAQIEALKDQLEGYQDVIDKRKELLDSLKEERAYQDDLEEKQKSISDIQAEILDLSMDDSEEAKAKRQELEAELADKLKELDTFQFEHGIEQQQQALDAESERLEQEIDDKIKIVENIQASTVKEFIQKLKSALGYIPTESSGTTAISTDVMQSSQSIVDTVKLNSVLSAGISGYTSSGFTGRLATNMMTPDSSTNMGTNIEKLIEINVSGNLDKDVIPDIERIAVLVIQKLNDSMKQRGYTRRADSYSL